MPQIDHTGKVACSLYGKGTVEGDTPIVVAGELVTLKASSAITTAGTVTETAVTGMGRFKRVVVQLDTTVADTEAGDTLDVYIDASIDGTRWFNVCHFAQVTGTTSTPQTQIAILDPANPGTATFNVTSDLAVSTTRPTFAAPQWRCRHVTVDVATLANMNFTFSVKAFGQA